MGKRAVVEVAEFRFAVDLVSFEGGPRFYHPVVVWITLIRGLTVRACSKAQRFSCRPDLIFRRHVSLLHDSVQAARAHWISQGICDGQRNASLYKIDHSQNQKGPPRLFGVERGQHPGPGTRFLSVERSRLWCKEQRGARIHKGGIGVIRSGRDGKMRPQISKREDQSDARRWRDRASFATAEMPGASRRPPIAY